MYFQQNQEPDSLLRTVQDGFVFLERVGRGAASVVYKAMEQAEENRLVAVKVLDATEQRLLASDGAANPFEREARFSRVLRDPTIVRLFKTGQLSDGRFYLAMEFVKGMTLEEELKHRRKIPWSEASDIMRKLAGAVATLHDNGIIHRDLKPGNVMVQQGKSGSLQVKLIDLGTARLNHERDKTPVGKPVQIIGSPLYVSPEQARGDGSSKRTDVYALGAIFFEMLTGRPLLALKRPTADACVGYLKSGRAIPSLSFSELGADAVPGELQAFVLAAVSVDPAARPADGAAFKVGLDNTLKSVTPPKPPSPLSRVGKVFSSMFKRGR